MAKVIRREWTSQGPTGRRVKHVAWGYTLMVGTTRERIFSSAWRTEAEAMTVLSERAQAVAAGQATRPATRTLGEVAAEYLTYKADQGKRSLKDDTRIVTRRLLPALGAETAVRQLTTAVVAQYDRQRTGQVSAYTVCNELAVLRHMLRLARRWGYLEVVPEFTLPKKPEGRLRFLSADELTRLVMASRNRVLAPLVVVAVHTGMRKGELLGLTWERIDLSSARITLEQTKSGKRRAVPINDAVYEALLALEPEAARRQARLFPPGNDRRGSQIRTAFEAALSRAGITGFRFHDLRHTAASHLVMRGAGLKAVQEMLGHSDLRMTLRYAHLSPAHLLDEAARLNGLTPRLRGPDDAPMAQGLAQSAILSSAVPRDSP